MKTFYHASSAQKSGLMVFVFLALLLCLCSFFALPSKKKAKRLRFLNAVAFIVLFTLDALMGHAFWGMREGMAYPELLTLPMGALWCIAAGLFMLLVVEGAVLLRGSRQWLHRDSVKQAMDTLPGAVCYFTPEGMVKLCNLQMHRLFRTLAQCDLQTLEELRRALADCDGKSGVIKLSEELQTYLFPNGKAWHYSESEVTASDGINYTEAVFTDVTELYEYSLKLGAQTKRLEQISREIRQLSYNVLAAAKEQEVLSVKTTLHDRMGAGMLAVRRILQSGKTAEARYAMDLFQKAVHIIKNNNEYSAEKDELAELMHDADTIGVRVSLSGELPRREELSHAFILAMRECLTNGVRHAGASEIKIMIEQNESAATLRITNNGEVPKSPIVAKGGLKNLERYIGNLQGTMEIRSEPSFALTVTIPFAKEGA